jgi:adenosylmethionine-8-amino-7-oxononanoate aminotransferase
MKTFFYGHSYTGNQLGCAAALANLCIFHEENVLEKLQPKIKRLAELLSALKKSPHVRETRQCGFIAGIELAREDGAPFDWRDQTGARVCIAARKHGLLTRPIGDVIALMPPFCITDAQLEKSVRAIEAAIGETL